MDNILDLINEIESDIDLITRRVDEYFKPLKKKFSTKIIKGKFTKHVPLIIETDITHQMVNIHIVIVRRMKDDECYIDKSIPSHIFLDESINYHNAIKELIYEIIDSQKLQIDS